MEEETSEVNKPLAKIIYDYYFELYTKPYIDFIFSKSKKRSDKKDAQPRLSYGKFEISYFKGINHVSVDFVKNNLVLLLGLNESGKSTILRAIESFDFLNDPTKDTDSKYFQNIRNKSDVGSNKEVVITAHINIESELTYFEAGKIGDRIISNERCV